MTRRTIVCLHAHPDDESLLMGGTMALLAARGHRLVLVTATSGEAGLAASTFRADGALGQRRLRELHSAADVLGCARVECLGYADSGMREQPSRAEHTFAAADVHEAAARVTDILVEERADVLTIYDPAGGYGHPDHIQVHRVGSVAAKAASTPIVLQATLDRRSVQRAVQALQRLGLRRRFPGLDPRQFDELYVARADVTHRVDVSAFLDQKRAALRAHASQATADDSARLMEGLLRLPRPLFKLVLGREWFVEQGRIPARRPLTDVLASLADG